MKMNERRKMERFSLQLLARVSVRGEGEGQHDIELLTKNISAGGAFIQTPGSLPIGTRLNIEVLLPIGEIKKVKGEMALIKVTGSVIRIDEKGMAISFDEDYQILPLE
jgi:hypothetical protein